MPDIDLITQLIDLKIERAVAAVMGELHKLGEAHNHVAGTVIPPLVADLERRTAAEEQDKDARIKALEAEVARLDALARAPTRE